MRRDGTRTRRDLPASLRATLLALPLALFLASAGVARATEIPEPKPNTARETSVLQQTGDVLIGRPVAFVRLVTGVVLLPITFPVSAVLGDPGWAWDVCVEDPYRALVRPISHP